VDDFPALRVDKCIRRNGNGYLRSRIRAFAEIARHRPVLVSTDLDTTICPAALRQEWLNQRECPPGLLLRVAQREIESWLLADHEAITALLGPSVRRRLPHLPDTLPDPKAFLLELARRALRDVRQDLLPEPGSFASKDLGYNSRLCEVVRTYWQPQRAAALSPSLNRTIRRIAELIP
jgi:hypothetical protein